MFLFLIVFCLFLIMQNLGHANFAPPRLTPHSCNIHGRCLRLVILCLALPNAATHCNTLQHAATQCSTLNTLQHGHQPPPRNIVWCVAECCGVVWCFTACYSVLQCVLARYCVLQCVAVWPPRCNIVYSA